MAAWKVLLILVLACTSLGLALGTLIVVLALAGDENRWLWGAALFVGCLVTSTLLALFLRREDRIQQGDNARKGYR
jgi:hypothetical protein